MAEDPIARFTTGYDAARKAQDHGAKIELSLELIRSVSEALMTRLQVTPSSGSTPLRQLHLADALVKAQPESRALFDDSRQPMPPHIELPRMYQAAWWLDKSAKLTPPGTLADGAPFSDMEHLIRVLHNSAYQLMVACPPPPPAEPGSVYWDIDPRGECGTVTLQNDAESLAERCWRAAHEPGPVQDWTTVLFKMTAGDLTDVLLAEDCEIYLHSGAFRDAVESGRESQDNHEWLPVLVASDGQDHAYWILNAAGPDAANTWGIVGELAAGRSVVPHSVGDNLPAFSATATRALQQACPHVRFHRVKT